ncbi:MAG: hypothetical protein HY676_04105 [Chloroflexi bacterium]|nr:hypothetical protein [Chloroflexota bacterium]
MIFPKGLSFKALALAPIAALVFTACSGGSGDELKARDQQIADLQVQLVKEQRDAKFWQQLTGLLPPVEMKSMSDHRALMLPTGGIIALHFDNMDLSKAQNLNWVALGVPGKFCKQDQERVEAQFGPGFTHFHDMKNDTHGGAKGAEGVWFVHTAVRNFDSPMSGGAVSQGIDSRFMPTPAPAC